MKSWKQTLWMTAATFLVGALMVVLLYRVPRNEMVAMTGDVGLLDHISVVFYALATVSFFWFRRIRPGWDARAGALLFLLFVLELDPGGWIAAHEPKKMAFWRSADVHLGEKTMVVVVALALLWLGASLARRHGRDWFRRLRRGRPEAMLVLLAGLFLVAAAGLDHYEIHLNWANGYRAWSGIKLTVRVLEEVLELLAPILLAWGVLLRRNPVSDRGS